MGAEILFEKFVLVYHTKKASHSEAHLFLYLLPCHSPLNVLKLKIVKILVKFGHVGFIENSVIGYLYEQIPGVLISP